MDGDDDDDEDDDDDDDADVDGDDDDDDDEDDDDEDDDEDNNRDFDAFLTGLEVVGSFVDGVGAVSTGVEVLGAAGCSFPCCLLGVSSTLTVSILAGSTFDFFAVCLFFSIIGRAKSAVSVSMCCGVGYC